MINGNCDGLIIPQARISRKSQAVMRSKPIMRVGETGITIKSTVKQ